MDIKEVLDKWKSIIAFIILIAGAVISIIAWAEEQKAVMRAEQHLQNSFLYQQSRIFRKEDQIREDTRELNFLESYIGDDEPTPRESRKIEALTENIRLLEKEIEEIKVALALRNE
jgi:hypothetical protein